jgi:hypothetical protein
MYCAQPPACVLLPTWLQRRPAQGLLHRSNLQVRFQRSLQRWTHLKRMYLKHSFNIGLDWWFCQDEACNGCPIDAFFIKEVQDEKGPEILTLH